MKRTLAALLISIALWPTGAGAEPNAAPARDWPLPCIRQYEHSSAPDDYSDRSGKYQTPYQFDAPTWNSNAKAGPHTDWVGKMSVAPPDIVDSMARVLHSRRGLQPWSKKVRRYCR